MQRRRELMTFEHGHWATATGSIATFNTPFAKPLRSLKAEFMPVQEGTGDPSPDNIRPITGWTGTKISHTGANLFGGNALGAAILGSCTSAAVQTGNIVYLPKGSANIKTAAADRIRILENQLPDGRYTIYIKQGENTNATRSLFTVFYTDGTSISIGDSHYDATAKVWRYPTNSSKSVRFIRMNRDASDPIEYDISQSGVFVGNVALADFAAYTGNTHDVAFPSEVGTVYGGTLDVTNGELVVNTVAVPITPDTVSNRSEKGYACVVIGTVGYVNADVPQICNVLPTVASASSVKNGAFIVYNSSGYNRAHIAFCFPGCYGANAAETRSLNVAKVTELIESGTTPIVVFGISEPQTYELTPVEVKTLLGLNNIWSTSNGNVTAEYWTR